MLQAVLCSSDQLIESSLMCINSAEVTHADQERQLMKSAQKLYRQVITMTSKEKHQLLRSPGTQREFSEVPSCLLMVAIRAAARCELAATH